MLVFSEIDTRSLFSEKSPLHLVEGMLYVAAAGGHNVLTL
jgi:hypothetical protein